MITSRSVLLRMKSVSDKSCRETRNTHFVFKNFLLFRSYCLWNFAKHGWTHKSTLQWLHIMFVRASRFLVLHCLYRLLVVLTGKCFPTTRRRTSSGTPLTPGFFFVRKCGLPLLFISRPTVSCLMRASRPERKLVTLTTIVSVPLYKTVQNRKVNEKVKQKLPPFEWAPPNCISFSSLVQANYSSHYCIVLCNCGRARNNRWCTVSVLSFHGSDMLGIAVRGQDCHNFFVLPLYCCHTSFSPGHEFSTLHPIISFENIWKPFPASSNRTHGRPLSFKVSRADMKWKNCRNW